MGKDSNNNLEVLRELFFKTRGMGEVDSVKIKGQTN
jgi:hypothetical protein